MSDDASSNVKRESDWKAEKNPDAWAREQELEKMQNAHSAEKFELGKALEEKDSELAKLRKSLEEAEARAAKK
jgi:hypothetical protein